MYRYNLYDATKPFTHISYTAYNLLSALSQGFLMTACFAILRNSEISERADISLNLFRTAKYGLFRETVAK
jgi:hypothetical protein